MLRPHVPRAALRSTLRRALLVTGTLLTGSAVMAGPAVAAQTAAPSAAPALPAGYASHAWALNRLAQAGIGVWSSGGCSVRGNANCTSLEGLRLQTIEWLITLKQASGCNLLVTGGTEAGHAGGDRSHWDGYRVDLNASGCLSAYVQRNFTRVGPGLWQSAAGNRYLNEGNHWDVTFV